MHSRRKWVLWINLILMSLFILITSVTCWGDPTFIIIFENQSEYDLIIYVNGYKVGNVSPGKQLIDTDPLTTTMFQIEAKNPQGEVIFSKTLTREQMQRVESLVYRVVIKP